MLPFLLLFIMIQPWWTSRWKIHSFLNVEDDDAPFTLTTSLGLPKAQWKRITNRLPTLQENLWNLSVWADKRRTYNPLPTEGAKPVRCQYCRNMSPKHWLKLGLNEEWRAKKSHKKFNPRIILFLRWQFAYSTHTTTRVRTFEDTWPIKQHY